MADAAQFEVDAASIAQLQRNLFAIQGYTGAEMRKVVRNAMRDLVRSAWRHTPVAHAIVNSKWLKMRDGKYAIRLHHRWTGARVLFGGTEQQAIDYSILRTLKNGKEMYVRDAIGKRVIGTGYARIGWLRALIGLGVAINLGKSRAGLRAVMATGRLATKEGPAVMETSATNLVPYIAKLNAQLGIARTAYAEVLAKQQIVLAKLAGRIGMIPV